MRLIDADELVAQMEADAEQMDEMIAKMFAYAAINDVNHAPTVDAQPERKKGKWIFKKSMMYCSECCDGFEVGNYHYFKFCPNCGCRMEGEENET